MGAHYNVIPSLASFLHIAKSFLHMSFEMLKYVLYFYSLCVHITICILCHCITSAKVDFRKFISPEDSKSNVWLQVFISGILGAEWPLQCGYAYLYEY